MAAESQLVDPLPCTQRWLDGITDSRGMSLSILRLIRMGVHPVLLQKGGVPNLHVHGLDIGVVAVILGVVPAEGIGLHAVGIIKDLVNHLEISDGPGPDPVGAHVDRQGELFHRMV